MTVYRMVVDSAAGEKRRSNMSVDNSPTYVTGEVLFDPWQVFDPAEEAHEG